MNSDFIDEHSKPKQSGRKSAWLPMSFSEMQALGWCEVDFLIITGDAYVDHPSFGSAIIARYLESLGFKVGIIAQPNWRKKEEFEKLGRPRLAVLVTAGNMDSMLNHYTSLGKKRRSDSYSPAGIAGLRPDRATLVYCNRVRELWGAIPLIIGGIEASLRRVVHYDFWSASIRRSLLVDSRADILVYGMAESAIRSIAMRLQEGLDIVEMKDIAGTCWKTHHPVDVPNSIELPSYEKICLDKKNFAEAFRLFNSEQNSRGKVLLQDQGAWVVVQNPPATPLLQNELDVIYKLPYMRQPHPSYRGTAIPALEEVEFSIVSHRGCMGECSFCAISSHQGRIVQTRSSSSILQEAKMIAQMEHFKGYIHDVGGPTANFRNANCSLDSKKTPCRERSCLHPKVCKHLRVSHSEYLDLLKNVRKIKGVKKVFIRSGLRYDYILADPNGKDFLKELCEHHVSGQLKVAPEHVSNTTLARMNKPPILAYNKFKDAFDSMNKRINKKQFLVPYFMCGHPGTTLHDAIELAEYMRDAKIKPEQVQLFTPTPGTRSTCMFYTGIDPLTGDNVHVPTFSEMKMQRALLQYWLPVNKMLVTQALREAGREDLIGDSPKALVKSDGKTLRKGRTSNRKKYV